MGDWFAVDRLDRRTFVIREKRYWQRNNHYGQFRAIYFRNVERLLMACRSGLPGSPVPDNACCSPANLPFEEAPAEPLLGFGAWRQRPTSK